ncbi:MAG TPA: hypothetical protein VE779_08650 [Candidatus Angelobacter sp.]|jgi:hypothetical protein|nr:hypothetical protein [Candidatus Angelobacter sp.]
MVTKKTPTTTGTPTKTKPATAKGRSRAGAVTSAVRTIGPAIPLAVAMLGGAALNSVKPTTPGAPPPPAGAVVQPGTFSPVCDLPFKGVRNPASDDHCGIQGDKTDPASQAEATAKNNFCAPTHDPDVLTYKQLLDLQTQSSGIPKELDDRKPIENLGEGNYVSYVAVIKNAHYSDTTGGEAVNCNMSGNPPNDIHIVLMSDPTDTDECHSTTAEMSPHYRPTNWTPNALNALKKPVRIKGQLFYDNSHTPCTASSRPNPKRASLWEIHPVYSIEVCKSDNLDECRNSTDPGEWTLVE